MVDSNSFRRSVSTRDAPNSRNSASTFFASSAASASFSNAGTERTANAVGDSTPMSKPNSPNSFVCSLAVAMSKESALKVTGINNG